MTDGYSWNVRADLPVAHDTLGAFAAQVNDFIEARQIDFRNRLNARMSGVGAEEVQAMFNSAARVLKDVEPMLEGKTAQERDEIQIEALKKNVFHSRELSYSARQYYKLGKLKAVLPQLDAQFTAQFEQLTQDRRLEPTAKAIASSIASTIALDAVKALYPEREGVRDMELYKDLTRVTRELTVRLTEHAGPKSGPANEAIAAFKDAMTAQTRALVGLPTAQRGRA